VSSRVEQRQTGWRMAVDDIEGLLDMLADNLANQPPNTVSVLRNGAVHTGENLVRRAAHLLRSQKSNVAMEARNAWDRYAAAALCGLESATEDVIPPEKCARYAADRADELLKLREERFGGKKNE
jgi:hypothetical protein